MLIQKLQGVVEEDIAICHNDVRVGVLVGQVEHVSVRLAPTNTHQLYPEILKMLTFTFNKHDDFTEQSTLNVALDTHNVFSHTLCIRLVVARRYQNRHGENSNRALRNYKLTVIALSHFC